MQPSDNKNFEIRKKQSIITSLCRNHPQDKSPKGSIDDAIRDLIYLINSMQDYRTTSSCSGRISIRSDVSTKVSETSSYFWWVFHDPIEDVSGTTVNLIQALNHIQPCLPFSVSFKFEPAIFHIECRTHISAQHLLQIALNSGFRNSGLCLGRKHIMLAIRSTASLEAPLIYDGKWVVDGYQYLPILYSIANHRFQENAQRLQRLMTSIVSQLKKELLLHSNPTLPPI
jgi:tRNA wybutosine-synthesizing protein 3